ncbi:phosphotransferase [Paenibacillus lentus]|uniref:phosphotransferase n=1 Tax=Paenibacillus lentus TaxID=1338368 RepID=UPI003669FBE6
MLKSILNHYPLEYSGDIRQGASGWNNTTYFIEGSLHRSVLRIYETHRDIEKIRFEHAVLQALNQLAMSFSVPLPIQTMTGETMVQLEDGSGRYACMFEYIEGMRSEGESGRAAFSFGEAAGELLSCLAEVEPGVQPAYRPYYELPQSYPSCSREIVLKFCGQPPEPFKDLQESLSELGQAYTGMLQQLNGLGKLPQQLIHGDLNYSNLLIDSHDPAQVTALLDFEFCTKDVRAMEPAVIISGLLGQGNDEGREAVRLFCRGFGGRIRLTPEEVEAIPVLMRLRQIDVFLHFMSRFLNGIDGAEVLRKQVGYISSELRQLERNEGWFAEALMSDLHPKTSQL